jgi:hypothetical protein
LRNTDKYSAVFTEYSVAEYSAGHYSAEYSADRIVGRSLATAQLNAFFLQLDTEINYATAQLIHTVNTDIWLKHSFPDAGAQTRDESGFGQFSKSSFCPF